MLPYIITFVISYVFCAIGEYCIRINKKNRASVFFFFAVLIVSILAGCRDLNVGTDTLSYTKYFFEYPEAKTASLSAYFQFYSQTYEPGFVLYEYFLSRIFNDSHWFLFFTSLIIFGFSLKAIVKYKNVCSVSLVWIMFLMLTCTESFNIMRQYMAMAIGMYAFTLAMEKKYYKFFIWLIVAVSLHYGAIIYIFIYLVYLYLRKGSTGVKSIIIIAALGIILVASSKIFDFVDLGFVTSKMKNYLSEGNFGFQINPFLIRLPFFLFIMIEKDYFVNGIKEFCCDKFARKYEGEFFILLLFLELIISQVRGISPGLYRFTSFLVFFKLIAYSRIACLQKGYNKYILYFFMWIYMIVIFIYWVVVLNSGIYPYKSELLGII